MSFDDEETYFHYTDKNSAKKIVSSGKILKSEGNGPSDDAVYGDGTYVTKIKPSSSTSKIAKNNYDGLTPAFWESNQHKTEVAIQLKVPKADMKNCSEDRDVHLYKGRDLHLDDNTKFHVRNDDGTIKTYSRKEFKKQQD